MRKLLVFELFKMRKRKSMYICTGVMLGMFLLNLFTGYAMMSMVSEDMALIMGMPTTMNSSMLMAANFSSFTQIAGIFIAIYVCEDYGQKTIKNVYSRGFSRTGVYFSKLLMCLIYAVASFVIVVLFALLFGGSMFGFKAEGEHIAVLLLGQLSVCIASVSFAFAISFMVRKLGAAIPIVIFVPLAITLVLGLADVVINSETISLSNYWLDGMLANLSTSFATAEQRLVGCILPVVYSALFITVGFFVHRKSEV